MMREAEIRALDLLGRDLPDVLDRLVRVAATVTGATYAEVHVITSTAQHTLAGTAGTPDPCGVGDSYCARIVREEERDHLVPDVRLDDRFKDSSFTTEAGVVTYAASQLVTSRGVPIGTLCVFDMVERVMGEEQVRALSELASAVMEVLEMRSLHQDMQEALADMSSGHRELRRSNEHLAAFAGQISHDVQGPLAAVLLSLQMLEEDLRDSRADVSMLLGSALSGAQRMRAMVAGLMDFAVIGGKLAPVMLDLGGVVAEVLDELTTRVGRARVEVGDLPKVWGDDVQVRAVVQNLLANALKYAGHVAEPVIRVTGQVVDGRTRVMVSDNGPGVPADQREAIFDLLVRGQGVEHSGVDGLGIGLATCRRILTAHGGTIGVGESPQGGAEFWFELPLPQDVSVAV